MVVETVFFLRGLRLFFLGDFLLRDEVPFLLADFFLGDLPDFLGLKRVIDLATLFIALRCFLNDNKVELNLFGIRR
jgi:hypothetical protein